jgi:hypothetical protein
MTAAILIRVQSLHELAAVLAAQARSLTRDLEVAFIADPGRSNDLAAAHREMRDARNALELARDCLSDAKAPLIAADVAAEFPEADEAEFSAEIDRRIAAR